MKVPQPRETTATGLTGSQQALEIGLPAAFAAFCMRHMDTYTRYAIVRTGDPHTANALVGAVLGDLAMTWMEVLQSPSPSALAWRLLSSRAGRDSASAGPYRVLPATQADAVLLHYRLGLPVEQAAEVMGRKAAEFTWLLKQALRAGTAALEPRAREVLS
ncbi:hypothetical protein ACIGHB_31140 [Streptomyces sp. NPDC085460]|uniref:hypothetical protein n=1 Tax=Streptomyces sp. NPDC085460 TaxID=3365723 RepID=UPI0037D16BA9